MRKGDMDQIYWAHANHTWLSITDWDKWWNDSGNGKMGHDLRELFRYDLGQERDLGITIDALQKQKYSQKFVDPSLAVQACIAQWSEENSGPLLKRVNAKVFATQWHYMLTAPGWESVRAVPNMDELLQGSVETMRILGQDKSVDQQHFQKWARDTMALAPVQWTELRQFAFSIWEAMEPQDRKKMNNAWAVQYDLCPDELAFLSYAKAEPDATPVQKLATSIKTALGGFLPGP